MKPIIPIIISALLSMSTYAQSTQAFLCVKDKKHMMQLKRMGVQVNAQFADFATVTLPSADHLKNLRKNPMVKQVRASHRLRLHTDASRRLTFVDNIHSGWQTAGDEWQTPFQGEGVIVGVIDVGIDYRHLAFRNADGTTRISRVYQPWDKNGRAVVVEGDTLPGSEYVLPEEILALGCDDVAQNHGSHTTGIAAGTKVGVYGGMAPKSELVLCGLADDLTETAVVNAAYYIANYAKQQGRPCVINMSLGSQDGPHDGSGFMAKAFDQIAQQNPNVIFVLSAGNEGSKKIYFHHQFQSDEERVSTMLNLGETLVDAWSGNEDSVKVQLSFVRQSSGVTVYRTAVFSTDTMFNVDSQIDLAHYFGSGTVQLTFEQNPYTGKRHVLIETNVTSTSSMYMGLTFIGKAGQEINAWEASGNSQFLAPFDGYIAGTNSCTISDMATGQHSISVGSYVNRQTHTSYLGSTITDTQSAVGSMSYYSSWGNDMNGVCHPFITAPGQCVISAYNSASGAKSTHAQRRVNPEGDADFWGVMSGTSMSAPCVAGIVALWLQANPALTISDVKKIITETAIKDQYVLSGQSTWGENGKIDARAGIEMALDMLPVGDINEDGIVNVADVTALVNHILSGDAPNRCDLNADGAVNVTDVTFLIDYILKFNSL